MSLKQKYNFICAKLTNAGLKYKGKIFNTTYTISLFHNSENWVILEPYTNNSTQIVCYYLEGHETKNCIIYDIDEFIDLWKLTIL